MIVPMQPEHAIAVFRDLSEQTLAEARAVELSPETLAVRFVDFMRHGTYVAHAFLEDEKPYCVMATRAAGVNPTFLVAGRDFFEKSLRHRREFKAYLAKLAQTLGGSITTVSDSPHPHAARWFKLMGYKEVVPQKVYRWG